MKKLIAIVLIALTMLTGCTATIEHRTEQPDTYLCTSSVCYIECAMCGAHVLEWWYVTGSDGELVEVCEYCYLETRNM